MNLALSGGRGPWLVSLFALLTVVLVAGCGGGPASQQGASLNAVNELQLNEVPIQDAGLPDPSTISRQPSSLISLMSCPGGDYRSDLAYQNVSAMGEGLLFTPGSGGGGGLADAAFAIYDFDLSGLPNPMDSFGVRLRVTDAQGDSDVRVFAGLGDLDKRSWEWVELESPPDDPEPLSWSWGVSNAGSRISSATGEGAVRANPYLPVAILVTGTPDPEFRVSDVWIVPSNQPEAYGAIAFFLSKKGYDYYQAQTSLRSVDLQRGSNADLHVSYYDNTNGQLYHMWQDGRFWLTQAVECDADAGSSHDLALTPAGGLALAFFDATNLNGGIKWNGSDSSSLVWSPRSNFETGLDEIGTTIEAGRNPSVVFDDDGIPHVFYECTTTGRIRHAWKPLGAIDWLHEYVSPEGTTEGQPIGLNTPYGVYCLTRKGWDGCIYGPDRKGTGWTGKLFATDLHNPLDASSELAYFDAACRDSTLVIAMACTGGQRLVRFDLDSEEITEDQIYNDRPGGGVFIDMVAMGDGSVRIAQYNAADKMIYFETGDIPGDEQFTSLPAVQYGDDEDCDGIAFWMDEGSLSSGFHDAFLVESSVSATKIGVIGSKKEFKGHVTLLK